MLALSLALVVSCNGKAGINKSETAETITEIPVEQESTETEMYVEGEDEEFEEYTPFESAPEYYNFIGNVAGLDVHMSLMSDRWGNVNGRYYYDSRGKKNVNTSMKFYGEFDGSKMILTEFFSDKPTGTFEGNWEADLYQGTFTRAKDGKMFDFHLTQVYSDIVPGGGEAFFEDFDDFYFDIPFFNEYNPSQGQTVMQPQPTEEQLRQQKLRRERALARTLAESLYSFDLEQPFTSVRSGHSTHFAKLSPAVKSMPSEEALKRALAKLPKADKTSSAGPSYEVTRAENYPNVPKAENYHEVPKAEIFYDAPKQEPVYEVPQSSTFSEPPALETASSPSSDKSTYSSQPTGESRYAKSPDPTYRGYQEDHTGGSRIAVIIALLVALLAVAAIFIMIRRYSTNLTNLLSGTPSQGTSETVSKAESEAEEESKDTAHTDDSREADTRTDSGQAADSQAAVSMAIQEEGEIYHSDSQTAETDEPGESIPEDPNDITYLASVNEKAAEDAIAELSDAAPRLYLSAYGIKIGVGDSFNALSYVERIEDDADDKNRLYRDISVDGLSEFDAKVPGTYELTYFCYDSAGNRSNRARLTVIVE